MKQIETFDVNGDGKTDIISFQTEKYQCMIWMILINLSPVENESDGYWPSTALDGDQMYIFASIFIFWFQKYRWYFRFIYDYIAIFYLQEMDFTNNWSIMYLAI